MKNVNNLSYPFESRAIAIPHYPFPINKLESSEEIDFLSLNKGSNESGVVYIHIPFCDYICPFCPYPKKMSINEHEKKEYVDALIKNMKILSSAFDAKECKIKAVHIGGGTPSSLSSSDIKRIIEGLYNNFNLSHLVEVTYEANPWTLTQEKINSLIDSGVNRVSLGVQTFNDELAKNIFIKQTPKESTEAIISLRNAGIENINIDMMYNLPGQTIEDWIKDLEKAVDLGVDSISLFPLNIIPSLELYKKVNSGEIPQQNDISFEKKLFETAKKILEENEYVQESAYDFSKKGKSHIYRTLHFSNTVHNVFALGVASHGEINGLAYLNSSSIEDYIKQINLNKLPLSEYYFEVDSDLPNKFMIFNLWLLKYNEDKYFEKFGEFPEATFPEVMEFLFDKKLLEKNGNIVKFSEQGLFWANNISRLFCNPEFSKKFPL